MSNNSDFYTPPQGNSNNSFTDIEVLASSRYSLILKARKLGRWFVLKALSEDYRGKGQYEMLLRKEYAIGFKFDHPNIVRYIDFITIEGYGNCIQMEYIVGTRLDEYLETKPSLKEQKRIVVQLCEGLRAIHAEQVIHRDLKFENILITENGHNVKIIDFGLSDADSYAILKEPAGTEGFMSPEQIEGTTSLDNRTDIYSLGVILQRFKLPVYYRSLIAKCAKADRDDRYQTIEAFLQAFTHRRQKLRVAAVALVGVISIVSFVALYQAPKAEQPSKVSPPITINKPKDSADSIQQQTSVPTTATVTAANEAPMPVVTESSKPSQPTSPDATPTESSPSLNALTDQLHSAIDDIMKPYIEKKRAGINMAEHNTFMHQMEWKLDELKSTFFSRTDLGESRTILLQEYDRYWNEKIGEYGRAGKVRQLTPKESREIKRRYIAQQRKLQDSLGAKPHQDTKAVQP